MLRFASPAQLTSRSFSTDTAFCVFSRISPVKSSQYGMASALALSCSHSSSGPPTVALVTEDNKATATEEQEGVQFVEESAPGVAVVVVLSEESVPLLLPWRGFISGACPGATDDSGGRAVLGRGEVFVASFCSPLSVAAVAAGAAAAGGRAAAAGTAAAGTAATGTGGGRSGDGVSSITRSIYEDELASASRSPG